MKGICLGYVLTVSNKGLPYTFVYPLPLLLRPAFARVVVDIGITLYGTWVLYTNLEIPLKFWIKGKMIGEW